jgi:hypothetical protein
MGLNLDELRRCWPRTSDPQHRAAERQRLQQTAQAAAAVLDGDGDEPVAAPHPAAQFLRFLGKDPSQTWCRSFYGKRSGNPPRPRKGRDLHGLDVARLQAENEKGLAVYAVIGHAEQASGVSKNTGKPTGAVIDDDIIWCPALFTEYDDKPKVWQANAWREQGLPEPSVQVDTGGASIHSYWVLDEPLTPEQFRSLQRRLLGHTGCDESIKNPSRVMRLPGFRHVDKATGKLGDEARLITASTRRCTAAELEACLPPELQQQQEHPRQQLEVTGQATAKPRQQSTGDLPPRPLEQVQAALQHIPPRVPGTGTYPWQREAALGYIRAVVEANPPGTVDQAVADLKARHPQWDDLDQVIGSSDLSAFKPGSFWHWVVANGGSDARPDLPSTEPVELSPITAEELEQQAAADRQREPGDPYRVGDCPPDLHAADLLHDGLSGHVASVAETLFRYDPATGCWEQWSDADATGEAQTVLRQMYRIKRQDGKPDRKVHQFGTIRNCRDAVASLKVKAGPGPLRDPSPPPVIVFTNGTYNLLTGQLERHSPEHGATYRIDAPYVPGATCPAPLQRVIEVCFPEGAEPIIRGLLRWVADPTIRYGEAVHLLGESGTGKGILLTFAGSLLPASLRSEVRHPADLDSPEKLHQFVLGRRLILFPDTPSRIQGAAHCGRFYELVENSPQTTRKLRAGEAERSRPMFARCLLASVKPLQFPDGRDGFLRRVRTLITLPRTGTPDPTLRADLVGSTEVHRRIRGEAVSWALAMPLEEVEAVLDGNDPEGLLRETAAEAAAASDTVSQWADECLIPHPLGPDREVDAETWAQMFEAYVGWCRYSGVQYAMQRSNFMGQLRTVLGPKRCLHRRKESRAEARARGGSGKGDRRHLHRFDAGFTLRPGVLRGLPEGPNLHGGINAGQGVPDRFSFDRLAIGTGGLKLIEALPQATHPDLATSPGTPPPDSPGTPSTAPDRLIGANNTEHAASPETPSLSQGKGQGCARGSQGSPNRRDRPQDKLFRPLLIGGLRALLNQYKNRRKKAPNRLLHPPVFHTRGHGPREPWDQPSGTPRRWRSGGRADHRRLAHRLPRGRRAGDHRRCARPGGGDRGAGLPRCRSRCPQAHPRPLTPRPAGSRAQSRQTSPLDRQAAGSINDHHHTRRRRQPEHLRALHRKPEHHPGDGGRERPRGEAAPPPAGGAATGQSLLPCPLAH